jgi:hypothetical protein
LAQPLFFENREDIEKRMDELARKYAETHDEKVKAGLEELSLRLADRLKAKRLNK